MTTADRERDKIVCGKIQKGMVIASRYGWYPVANVTCPAQKGPDTIEITYTNRKSEYMNVYDLIERLL